MDSPEDGRFFAALRMTCFAITIDDNCRSSVGTNCHPEEAGVRVGRTFLSAHVIGVLLAWIQIDEPPSKPSVRANGPVIASAARPIEKTGDSSTPLRMTCFAITIGENCRSSVGTNCHPEEAARLTKDLLRHWIIHAICTCQYLRGSTFAPLSVPGRVRGRGRHARHHSYLIASTGLVHAAFQA